MRSDFRVLFDHYQSVGTKELLQTYKALVIVASQRNNRTPRGFLQHTKTMFPTDEEWIRTMAETDRADYALLAFGLRGDDSGTEEPWAPGERGSP